MKKVVAAIAISMAATLVAVPVVITAAVILVAF